MAPGQGRGLQPAQPPKSRLCIALGGPWGPRPCGAAHSSQDLDPTLDPGLAIPAVGQCWGCESTPKGGVLGALGTG